VLCYGYRIVENGERGARQINQIEAAVVRRIFADFAAGKSPRAIAAELNREGISGPGGRTWGDTTIRGQRDQLVDGAELPFGANASSPSSAFSVLSMRRFF
jgi:hypothetical protein